MAMCKASAEGIGMCNLMTDYDKQIWATVYADSSAAIAISKRRGSGKLRHINVGLLWIQEKEKSGDMTYVKIRGDGNPADVFAKYVATEVLDKHSKTMQITYAEGRASQGLNMQGTGVNQGTGKVA